MKQPTDIPRAYFPKISELPGDLARLAEIIETVCPTKGVEATIAIVNEFRGTNIYCRNLDAIKRKARNRRIIEEFSGGSTAPKIAREVGLGVRQVWAILGSETIED